MEFELRTLKSDDLFPMFGILSKIGFKDLKEILDRKAGIFNSQSGDSRDYGSICSYFYFFTSLCICFNSQIR